MTTSTKPAKVSTTTSISSEKLGRRLDQIAGFAEKLRASGVSRARLALEGIGSIELELGAAPSPAARQAEQAKLSPAEWARLMLAELGPEAAAEIDMSGLDLDRQAALETAIAERDAHDTLRSAS